MIEFFKKQKIQFYVLLGILLLGLFLRFYNYPYRYSLGEETIRDAVVGIEGARELQFPLTGSFSSLGPFTFGPWYAYQLIIFYLIFPFLYSPWIYLGIISVIYIFIMYKVGRVLGGSTFGLITAFLAAISPAQIISATHLTNPNNTNFFAALSIWLFLILLLKSKSTWWYLIFGFLIGVGINLHFQMGSLLILPLILLIYKRKISNFMYSALGVLISFIPMLIFEMNNHWFTVRNMFFYLTEGKNAIYVPNRWLFYVRDFWPAFWSDALGVPVWFGNLIIFLFLIVMAWSIYNKKISLKLAILIGVFLLNFILLRYYWGPRFFGYLNFLRPFIFIFTAFAVINLKYKKVYLGFILIPLVVLFSYPRIVSELASDPFSKIVHDKVSELKEKYPSKNFSLFTCSKKYNSTYNSVAFSTLFLLDKSNKFGDDAVKIAFQSDCDYPKGINIASNPTGKEEYLSLGRMRGVKMMDFSSASDSAILEAGWESLTFAKLYDNYARWWFQIQP
ncbi:MAG: glycosyltransferase family 39 protein [Candidatus Levybacteria bacterium]|nr:glycosyltransferase family 39 protein [Candidatus Levybacteria bacterium]